MTAEERVATGAAWLDAKAPGWVDKIDLDKFNIGSCFKCIAGQVFGDYDVVFAEDLTRSICVFPMDSTRVR